MPQTTPQSEISRSIYINPNFHKISQEGTEPVPHINPLFLQANRKPQYIHMNPKFLEQKIREQHLLQTEQLKETKEIKLEGPCIHKSRTKIVRVPMLPRNLKVSTQAPILHPLLTLSKRKLVRRSSSAAPATSSSTKLQRTQKIYKVDNRLKVRRRSFVARYALRRALGSKINETASTSNLPTYTNQPTTLRNKKLQLLNINGVLYKSSCNKLQREDITHRNRSAHVEKSEFKSTRTEQQKLTSGRTLFVRGTKFVMDAQGFKLTRMSHLRSTYDQHRKRIDIGGLTYVASQTQNVFVRTRNHLTIAHLNSAKQRSLLMLSRRLVKSNVPCAIFQRLGKCIAFLRGKCSRVHNKQQISICPSFLRGECHKEECLLSHNVSLSKMPVCKFFLQGVCVRSDCPYLHKKVSQQTEICLDFVRGFCRLAEQCPKRHEFLCPRSKNNGKCEEATCKQCKNKQRTDKSKRIRNNTPKEDNVEIPIHKESDEIIPVSRYFIPCSDEDQVSEYVSEPVRVKDRPKVGALPAFIPL